MDDERADEDAGRQPDEQPDESRVPVLKPEHLRRGGRPRPGPSGDPGSGARAVQVAGVVQAGVEHGSVVLTGSDGRTWQLGRGQAHLVGCTVSLRGRRRDVMTTAQQGVPLEVLAVEVVSGTPGRPGDAPGRT